MTLDILEQIKSRQFRLVAIYKTELTLKDKNQTLPFEDIGNSVNPAGCYYHNEGKPTVSP